MRLLCLLSVVCARLARTDDEARVDSLVARLDGALRPPACVDDAVCGPARDALETELRDARHRAAAASAAHDDGPAMATTAAETIGVYLTSTPARGKLRRSGGDVALFHWVDRCAAVGASWGRRAFARTLYCVLADTRVARALVAAACAPDEDDGEEGPWRAYDCARGRRGAAAPSSGDDEDAAAAVAAARWGGPRVLLVPCNVPLRRVALRERRLLVVMRLGQ